MSKRATRVCWTLNNYTEEHIAAVKLLSMDCKYIVFGKEVGDEGTPHLQGFLILKKQKRMSAITQWFTSAVGKAWHSEIARGTNDEAANYCKKDGDYWETGDYPKGRGTRTDVKQFLEAVREGQDDDILASEWPDQWVKYHKAADRLRGVIKAKKRKLELAQDYEAAELRQWQQVTIRKLEAQDDRKVTWVYDPEGNMGKSWLANYLLQRGDCYLVEGGKRADVAHAYNHEQYVVFDYTRSQEDQVNYSLIESFKNGRIFSSKYESHMKLFKPAKVLCLSNFDPDREKLSKDRWQVLEFPPQSMMGQPPKKKARLMRQDCTLCIGGNCNVH